VSNPDYLHRVLPSAQIAWLKAHVFNTQHHYDQIIRPIETQLAIGGNVNAGAFDALLIRAHQQFTRQQLEAFAQLLARLLQRMSLERAGQRVA